jgi:hypothetical protein
MTIDTANLRTLASAATPGPWAVKLGHATFGDGTQVAYVMEDAPDPCRVVAYEVGLPEASFIAAASPSVVLALLDEVERLRADTEAAEQRLLCVLDGTFSVGDGTAQREIERLRALVAGAAPHVNRQELAISDMSRKLAAVSAARDEACQIAERLAGLECDSTAEERIASLRKVGQ